MTRLALALLALVALSGCGAELATTSRADATPPKPPSHPPELSRACTHQPPQVPTTSTAPPSIRLFETLGILRRPKTAEDTPPASAFRYGPPLSGVKLDAARRTVLPNGDFQWIIPVENLNAPIHISEACLRSLPAEQREMTRKAITETEQLPPVEGVVIARGVQQPQVAESWPVDAIASGQAFNLRGCTGPMHNRVTVAGLVPDSVTQVTVTARDGAIVQATPKDNVVSIERDRPDKPSGLPAHITSTTAGAPFEYALDKRLTRGLDKPCEPPTKQSIGQRRQPPTKLDSPKGARIELQTRRWQPEDTNPQLAGATYRESGRRCLLVAAEQRLRDGKSAHRFCVEDAELRAEGYIARATRLPNGDAILEGFVDPDQMSWITVERSTIASGAFRLPPAKGSGAFFIAIRGKHASGGTFKLHAARRGAPVRYTGMRTVRLNPSP